MDAKTDSHRDVGMKMRGTQLENQEGGDSQDGKQTSRPEEVYE
jgi:hypothetical protein